jgi:hypothetical protein
VAKGKAGIGQVQGFYPTGLARKVNMHIACMFANAIHVLQIVNVDKSGQNIFDYGQKCSWRAINNFLHFH